MSRGGFTILEMLVVISVMILLSSLALSYDRSSERQLLMFREQSRVVNLLNRAKTLAANRFNASPSSGVNVCGVGFRVQNSKDFLLFQDFVASGNCDNSDFSYSGTSENIESYTLGDRIVFPEPTSNGTEVIFIPPHMGVTSTQPFPVNFQIQATEGAENITISVSKVGQITAQE